MIDIKMCKNKNRIEYLLCLFLTPEIEKMWAMTPLKIKHLLMSQPLFPNYNQMPHPVYQKQDANCNTNLHMVLRREILNQFISILLAFYLTDRQ